MLRMLASYESCCTKFTICISNLYHIECVHTNINFLHNIHVWKKMFEYYFRRSRYSKRCFFSLFFFPIYYFSIVFWFYLSESIQFYFSDFVSDSRNIFGINRPIISALFMSQWILGVGRFHGSVTFGRSVEFSGYSCFLAQ